MSLGARSSAPKLLGLRNIITFLKEHRDHEKESASTPELIGLRNIIIFLKGIEAIKRINIIITFGDNNSTQLVYKRKK
jgi:uncharacterized ferredoxin-like protein